LRNEATDNNGVLAAEMESGEPTSLPSLKIQDMAYAVAFTFPDDQYGESDMNYSDGILEQSGGYMYVVGHAIHGAIAQFRIPALVVSEQIADLQTTGDPTQFFATVFDRAPTGNAESSDRITGMEVIDGRLIVNAHEWYDAPGTNTDTTLVVSDATDIGSSAIEGFFDFPGAARSGGWISPIPSVWRTLLNGTYMTGFSSATSIISRHSVGPSAHAFYPRDVFAATLASPDIATTKLVEFSLSEPISIDIGETNNGDLYNNYGLNDLWTISASAWYGFIVPGTRTYATFGSLAGRDSGLGYKITQDNGNLCGGPCAYEADDEHTYYWFFDVNFLLRVEAGELAPSAVRTYEYGVFPAPFQPAIGANGITGGTFDEASGLLYLTLDQANTEQGAYARTPIVTAFRFLMAGDDQ